jgi:hypothetical protein
LSTIAGELDWRRRKDGAMLEVYGYNQELYGGMVLVDIVVANLWMAIL